MCLCESYSIAIMCVYVSVSVYDSLYVFLPVSVSKVLLWFCDWSIY